jgi:uncharacterized Tic20 family protein
MKNPEGGSMPGGIKSTLKLIYFLPFCKIWRPMILADRYEKTRKINYLHTTKTNKMDTQNLMGNEYTPSTVPTSDEKTLAILAHALALFSFLGPLIIYLIKKDQSPYVAEHAKESLNFQITMFILFIISAILIIVLIGFLLIWALSIANLVLIIIASIKASENKLYRYPFNFRLIK